MPFHETTSPLVSILMHHSDRWLADPSALDIQPSRQDKLAKQQLDRLVAAGLVSSESARSGSRSKKRSGKGERRAPAALGAPIGSISAPSGWLADPDRALS